MLIAYFDCFSGISGDMTLGAFIDLGVEADWLQQTIQDSLQVKFDLNVARVHRMGISATQVEVVVKDSHERHYEDICRLIENSKLSDRVKTTSLKIFDALAEAEARIHGMPKAKIHFHELGAVDAIADIVGASLCVDHFNFEKIISSKLPLGRGFVKCAHGTLPGPAPATLEILKQVPVYGADVDFEFITPTGAAIIKTFAESFGSIPDMEVSKISYGAGSKELETVPNLLRVIVGKSPGKSHTVIMIETNIDDMNPEIYGYVMEKLLAEGALDVCLIPVWMKKNRPGTILQVMCNRKLQDRLIAVILSETTTLGVRHYPVHRQILERRIDEIMTPFGKAPVKLIHMMDGSVRIAPEYDWCRKIAKRENVPIRKVYDIISRLAEKSND
jgi:pyridinium-3,5-bisthiocarboxylic acid mononucleotide nickel chelatase